jgi:hypothetical protein
MPFVGKIQGARCWEQAKVVGTADGGQARLLTASSYRIFDFWFDDQAHAHATSPPLEQSVIADVPNFASGAR